jgi:NAD(P)-dependent dehydrogenase (short-subunit alcohol dehydrogenase family)
LPRSAPPALWGSDMAGEPFEDLRDAGVLVVGGTRGIGLASSLLLAQLGARVAITGRSQKTVGSAVAEAAGRGREIVGRVLDMNTIDRVDALVEEIEQAVGPLHAAVLNAGANPFFERAVRLTPAQWDDLMAVNLRGPFFAAQAVGRRMLGRSRGSIVFVSSVTASRGAIRGLPYVATKGGMDSVVRSLAAEWASEGVRVNAVAPGYVETDMTSGLRDHVSLSATLLAKVAMGRYGRPDEIARIIAVLCSDLSSYMTGQIIAIDGGYLIA